jgi:hypothetical protein
LRIRSQNTFNNQLKKKWSMRRNKNKLWRPKQRRRPRKRARPLKRSQWHKYQRRSSEFLMRCNQLQLRSMLKFLIPLLRNTPRKILILNNYLLKKRCLLRLKIYLRSKLQ